MRVANYTGLQLYLKFNTSWNESFFFFLCVRFKYINTCHTCANLPAQIVLTDRRKLRPSKLAVGHWVK